MARPLLAALLLCATGCATIVRGGHQYVSAQTRPTGATMRVGGATCTTPCALRVPRNRSIVIELEKAGYEPRRVPVSADVDGLIVGNLVLLPFFFVGVAVDLVTGAAWDLQPSWVSVALRPVREREDGPPRSPFDGPARPQRRGDEAAPPDEDDDDEWLRLPGEPET